MPRTTTAGRQPRGSGQRMVPRRSGACDRSSARWRSWTRSGSGSCKASKLRFLSCLCKKNLLRPTVPGPYSLMGRFGKARIIPKKKPVFLADGVPFVHEPEIGRLQLGECVGVQTGDVVVKERVDES